MGGMIFAGGVGACMTADGANRFVGARDSGICVEFTGFAKAAILTDSVGTVCVDKIMLRVFVVLDFAALGTYRGMTVVGEYLLVIAVNIAGFWHGEDDHENKGKRNQ